MLDHSHHTQKSMPINLMTQELSDLNQKCRLNVVSTSFNSKIPTLLLLHGYIGTTQDYHQFFHLFNDSYNIISCDLRGHGKSDPCTNKDNSISWTISDFASDIYQIVTQFVDQGHKVKVIASSMSTAIALQLATDYSEIVETMFLISPTLQFKVPPWINNILFFERILPKTVMQSITMNISNLLIKLSKRQKDPMKRDFRIRGIERFQKLKWPTHRKILTQALKLWKADVSLIKQPVFIIAGLEDNIVPYKDSLKLHQLLTNSTILTIHSKHQILINRIKLIIDILEQWLEKPEMILEIKFICAENLVKIDNKYRIPFLTN